MSNYKVLKQGTVVLDKYRIIEQLGSGSFGTLFSAEDINQHTFVALKVESTKIKHPQLEREYKIYANFADTTHFPNAYEFASEGEHRFLVMDLLGKSIEDRFQKMNKPLSLKTVLMLADQMITAVEYLHKKSYIHRDLKPDNFMLGTGKNANQVYLIDFGLSKYYRSPVTHVHREYSEDLSLVGTARYASINALKGCEQSRRDDMESLGYIWMYLLIGKLPWQGLPAPSSQKYAKILEVKQTTPLEVLCKGFPHEFVEYLQDVKSLGFTDEPNYNKYRRMFRNLFIKSGFIYDYEYDWKMPVKEPPAPREPNTQPTTPKRSVRHIIPSTTDSSNNQTANNSSIHNSVKKSTNLTGSPSNTKNPYNFASPRLPMPSALPYISKSPMRQTAIRLSSQKVTKGHQPTGKDKKKVFPVRSPSVKNSLRHYTFRKATLRLVSV